MSTVPEVKAASDLEKTRSHSDEKTEYGSDTIDLSEGDEALQLVGTQRTSQFSDEYNRKLRRKLVRKYSTTSITSAEFP
jgi:hypothetical protein